MSFTRIPSMASLSLNIDKPDSVDEAVSMLRDEISEIDSPRMCGASISSPCIFLDLSSYSEITDAITLKSQDIYLFFHLEILF